MRGAVIGPELAEKYGWKIGSTFQLESFIPPYRAGKPFEFVVRAIYDTDTEKYPNHPLDLMLFHWKYLYETTGQRVGVGTYNAADRRTRARRRPIAKAVDATFENSDDADQDRDRGAVRRGLPRDGRRPGADPQRDRDGASRSRSCSSPPTR